MMRSLRFRMMALFCAVVGVFLAGTYVVIYTMFVRELGNQLDRRLLEAAKPVIADLIADPTEQNVTTLDLPNQYLELLDSSGRLLQYSRGLQGRPLDTSGFPLDGSQTVFRNLASRWGRLRMAVIPFRQEGDLLFLAIAVPARDTEQALASFRRMLLVLLPLNLLAMAAVSAWYVGRSLRPIVDLTQHAAHMTQKIGHPFGGDLQTPLPVVNPHDELGRLAVTVNQLFDRVRSALRQLRQFVSDASHELRTPISVLRGETELLLSEPRAPEDYRKTLRVIDGELKKLGRIVEGLFTLSMADAGQLHLASAPLHLDEVLEEACELVAPVARSKSIAIERDLKREIAYMGIGISSEHLPHIFERFYRAALPDTGEARSGGLGQAIVQAQRGSIQCQTEPGSGSSFVVTLPLPPSRS